MPSVFKSLASIAVWILFVLGCLSMLTSLPIPYLDFGGQWQGLAVGIASLFLSVVSMKLRKALE